MIYKKIIPASLLGRTLIIVFIPIVTLVFLTSLVFYQTSWSIISKRLTQSVIADIEVVVKLIDENLENKAFSIASENFKMKVKLEKDKDLSPLLFKSERGILSKRLRQQLEELNKPFSFDLSNLDEGAEIIIELKKGLLIINVDKDRLYSESAFVFLLWMIFASLILLLLAYIFMKGQIKPLKRLAIIAETFGRGLDAPEIKESGATEIRQTANAFNQMRTRIKRFLKQRTDMLAGVSHDLRTPLTRMKLQLSLMEKNKYKNELENDVNEMTAMLDSYVSFVKGESPDAIQKINFKDFLNKICLNIQKKNHELNLNIKDDIISSGRPLQLKRSINNIIENSIRYAKKIEVELSKKEEDIVIIISDDGPGIPKEKYEDVFKPFYTLDPSRNNLKGESGLGMTIARDIIRSHGGDIKLSRSNLGGLKTIINLPT